MKNKKSSLVILLGVLAILLSLLGIDFPKFQAQPGTAESQVVETVRVIDGDTIQVKDTKTDEIFAVRYLGIDTPELEGADYESCFSSQAKDKNEELTSDQKLLLEFDRDRYDRFGRTLAYIYTLDISGEKETFVNLELLQNGYARFYLDKQNTLHQDEFTEASLIAHNDFLGLWGECGEPQFNNQCVIKGNIDRLGHKYYHLPGDKYYSQTDINFIKEDQWLCAIAEAEAKNFQRAVR